MYKILRMNSEPISVLLWLVLLRLSYCARVRPSGGTLSPAQAAFPASNAYDGNVATCAATEAGTGLKSLTLTLSNKVYIRSVAIIASDDEDIGAITVLVNDREIGHLDGIVRGSAGYIPCYSVCYGDQVKLQTSSNILKVCDVAVFPREDFINLALGKVARQSSTDKQNSAQKAVDGSTDPTFADGRCSSTADNVNEEKVWWSVDLGDLYLIRLIRIQNQATVNFARLRDFKAMIAREMTTYSEIDPRLFTICYEQVAPATDRQQLSMDCPYGTVGQFAVIYKERSWYSPLQLCEVWVIGGPIDVNLALKKPTMQIDEVGTSDFTRSAKGVDGIAGKNKTLTTFVLSPGTSATEWWMVNLRSIYVITHVIITNVDDDTYDRLKNFQIVVKLGDTKTSCYSQSSTPIARNFVQMLYCTRTCVGQYVYVEKSPAGGDPLQFVELEVYGYEFDGNVALLSTITASATNAASPPEAANDDIWAHYAAVNYYAMSDVTSSAWIMLAFDKQYFIGDILMKNIDTCTPAVDCLNNFRILVTQTEPPLPVVAADHPECNTFSTGSNANEIVKLSCVPLPMWGQYLIVYSDRVIKLMELAVYPAYYPRNVLYGQTASSSDSAALSSVTVAAALDGVKLMTGDLSACDVLYGAASVEWFKVDMDGEYRFWEIIIYVSGKPVTQGNFELSATDKFNAADIQSNDMQICFLQIEEIRLDRETHFRCNQRVTGSSLVLIHRDAYGRKFAFCEIEARGTLAAENLAYRNQTWMVGGDMAVGAVSSQVAVDGDLSPDFKSRSCSSTGQVSYQPLWWTVDLLLNYTINLIRVINRGDDNGDWLTDVDYLVRYNFTYDNVNATSFWLCERHQGIYGLGDVVTAVCAANVTGRYVTIRKPFSNQSLVLCEVEVEGQPFVSVDDNLAQFKLTSQSTNTNPAVDTSLLAVDGIYDPLLSHMSCAITSGKQQVEWWAVDMKAIYQLMRVVIAIHGQDLVSQNHTLSVWAKENFLPSEMNHVFPGSYTVPASSGSRADFSQCYSRTLALLPGQMIVLDCGANKATGTHAIIAKENALGNPLILCEVEVYGVYVADAVTTPAPPTPPPTPSAAPTPSGVPTQAAALPMDTMTLVYAAIGAVIALLVILAIILGILKRKGIIGASKRVSGQEGVKEAWSDKDPIHRDSPERPRSVSSVKTVVDESHA